MLENIKYAIPSYKRIDTLQKKTISMLERYQIPSESIYIFTAPEEFASYQNAFPKYNVIMGELGLMRQRNYITLFFEEGAPLVCLDDDIESLHSLVDGKLVPLEDLKALVDGAFLSCQLHNLSLWGIYPIKNAFFMSNTLTTDLKFCIGHMCGIINRREVLLTIDLKDDYERTLRFYKRDGGVLRLNWVCAKTLMYVSGGIGLKQKERLEENMKSARTLAELFPGLVRMNKKREGEIFLSRSKADVTPRVERTSVETPKRVRGGLKGMESSKTK